MSRTALATILLLMLVAPTVAQPCNPVIDGTYCAEESNRRSNTSTSSARLAPIGAFDVVGAGADRPATLGGITFSGNSRCIGLLRRGACN